MVGVERFELPTHCSQSSCATRLRYTPKPVNLSMLRTESVSVNPYTSKSNSNCSQNLKRPPYCVVALEIWRARRDYSGHPALHLPGSLRCAQSRSKFAPGEFVELSSFEPLRYRAIFGAPSGPIIIWRARRDSNSRPPGS